MFVVEYAKKALKVIEKNCNMFSMLLYSLREVGGPRGFVFVEKCHNWFCQVDSFILAVVEFMVVQSC